MQWSDAGVDSDGSLQVWILWRRALLRRWSFRCALLVILFLLQPESRLGLSLDARHRGGELGL